MGTQATIDPTVMARNLVAAASFVDWINAHGNTPDGYEFSLDAPGKRFVRIVHAYRGTGRSVHCFIDLANGDVLKAAGWKAPAKGARGSIATAEGMADIMERFNDNGWSGRYLYLK